jgi:hypothetical protein
VAQAVSSSGLTGGDLLQTALPRLKTRSGAVRARRQPAVSGVRMPKPTITGRSVCALMRATSGATSAASAAAAPVMPVIET